MTDTKHKTIKPWERGLPIARSLGKQLHKMMQRPEAKDAQDITIRAPDDGTAKQELFTIHIGLPREKAARLIEFLAKVGLPQHGIPPADADRAERSAFHRKRTLEEFDDAALEARRKGLKQRMRWLRDQEIPLLEARDHLWAARGEMLATEGKETPATKVLLEVNRAQQKELEYIHRIQEDIRAQVGVIEQIQMARDEGKE